jgi:hypothetical protein
VRGSTEVGACKRSWIEIGMNFQFIDPSIHAERMASNIDFLWRCLGPKFGVVSMEETTFHLDRSQTPIFLPSGL